MDENATILIADDEPILLRLMQTILTRAGYKVLAAPNGRDALEICERAVSIDVAILDVTMSHVSGPEVLRRIEESYPAIRGILTSGFSPEDMPLEICSNRFLKKPFTKAEILQVVGDVFGEGARAVS